MYTLLLVDDEKEILAFLADICAEITEYELDIYRADSASAALDIIRRVQIDIVLSDIRMPGMDGLELLEIARQELSKCRFIMLTGYRNFDSVYQAVQYGDVRYLLKTETDDKIREAVILSIQELETELQNEQIMQKANRQIQKMLPVLQEQYLGELLDGVTEASESLEQRQETAFPIPAEEPFLMFLGRFDRIPDSACRRLNNQAIIKELLLDCLPIPCFPCSHAQFFVWLMRPFISKARPDPQLLSGAVRRISGALSYVQKACTTMTGESISFILGRELVYLEGAKAEYERLSKRIMQRVGIGEGMLIEADTDTEEAGDSVRYLARGTAPQYEMLRVALENGQKQKYYKLFYVLTEGMTKEESDISLEIYYNISMILLGHIHRCELRLREAMPLSRLTHADEHATWQEAAEYLAKLSEQIFDEVRILETSRATVVMKSLTQYIDSHLREDLTLAALADYVHFNPSYLSRLFKQEMGVNLSEYILSRRIEQAKRLLRDSQKKVGDIAAEVGYRSLHSFSRLFRNVTGQSPQDYRVQYKGN